MRDAIRLNITEIELEETSNADIESRPNTHLFKRSFSSQKIDPVGKKQPLQIDNSLVERDVVSDEG